MADAQTSVAGNTIQFELVSPERVLVSEPVRMVVVPGEEGDFGVLADHAPLLSSIRPGVVSVHGVNGDVRKIFVAGGFADVSGALCAVLAEEATNVEDLDKAALEKQLADWQDDLSFAKEDTVKTAALQAQIETAKAKLAAIAA